MISRYVVPFLDYVEQDLPVSKRESRGGAGLVLPPAVIRDSLSRFRSQHPNEIGTCFVMMRFGTTSLHGRPEKAIKGALERHGLTGLLARDREFHDELYANIQTPKTLKALFQRCSTPG